VIKTVNNHSNLKLTGYGEGTVGISVMFGGMRIWYLLPNVS